nr:hypothetical protein [Tanacetum cinerariifolium]
MLRPDISTLKAAEIAEGRQPSSDLINDVAENFVWKPGLKMCSAKDWRKIQHLLSEHGVADMLGTSSSMLRLKLHPKCDSGSVDEHYLGKNFQSSRRLTDVNDFYAISPSYLSLVIRYDENGTGIRTKINETSFVTNMGTIANISTLKAAEIARQLGNIEDTAELKLIDIDE